MNSIKKCSGVMNSNKNKLAKLIMPNGHIICFFLEFWMSCLIGPKDILQKKMNEKENYYMLWHKLFLWMDFLKF